MDPTKNLLLEYISFWLISDGTYDESETEPLERDYFLSGK